MLKNYLIIAFRNIRKQRAHSLLNILGLSIGMAAFMLIFMFVGFELSYDQFHEQKDRIFRIRNDRIYATIHDKSAGCPPALGPALKEEFREVEAFTRVHSASWMNPVVYHKADSHPSQHYPSEDTLFSYNEDKVFFVDGSFFRIFSFPLVKGNTSALEEPDTAVITEKTAKKYFGREPAMGKILTVATTQGTRSVRIRGVAQNSPGNSHLKFNILLSFKTLIGLRKQAEYTWGWNAFNTFILLRRKADSRLVEAKLPQLVKKYKNHGSDYKRLYLLQSLPSIHLHSHLRHEPEVNGNIRTVGFLIIIGCFILLVAFLNYINLAVAQSILRAREVGIRKLLGSGRRRLIAQFFIQSLFLNAVALVIALATVGVVLPFFNDLTERALNLSYLAGIWPWLLTAAITGLVLTCIYPAVVLASYRTVSILKGNLGNAIRGLKAGRGLVVLQFVISIILIVSTLTVYKQLSYMQGRDLGVSMEQTLVVKTPSNLGYKRSLQTRFASRSLGYSSIKAFAASDSVPGREYSNAASGIRRIEMSEEYGKRCFFINAAPGYFNFYNIPLVAGRFYTESDKDVIILNEEAVKLMGYEKPRAAIQREIVFGGLGNQVMKVVGVIKNYHHKSLKSPLQPVIFQPFGGKFYSLKIQSENMTNTIAQVKDIYKSVFPGQPFEFFFLDELYNRQYKPDWQFGRTFGVFTFLALVICCFGLFSLASFRNRQRTREIGIRKTLGASVTGIVRLLTTDTILMVAIATVVAWPLAFYLMTRWLSNYAYKTTLDIGVFLISLLSVLGIALLTTLFQSLKAALANPVQSIRCE